MRALPDFSFEQKLWKKGFKVVAGVDEVGRGCFAGPVVAGCVAFKDLVFKGSRTIRIDDSKKLTPRQREKAGKWVRKNAMTWGIGAAPVSLINRVGMGKATKVAFRRAIAAANSRVRHVQGRTLASGKIDFLLADAFFIPYVPGLPTRRTKDKKGRFRRKANGRQLAIVNGDEKSISIAAASIVAKVYRDKLMKSLSKQSKYKIYGWGRNKGYGTKEHQKSIRKYGLTRYHRKQFVETFFNNSSSFQAQ